MPVKRNVEGLRQNAQKKRQEALDKVEQGIRQLLKEGKPINFNTVTQAADVSKAFLYKEPEIKERIEQLRQQGAKKQSEPRRQASDASKDAVIRTLRERIKKLELEVRDLRRQNETAYGQVIEVNSLRQQVGRLQAENDRLRQQTPPGKLQQISSISDVEAEVRSLGVELNSTIRKLLHEAPVNVTEMAVQSLKEAIDESRVENRAGFLNKAIQDAWNPNDKLGEEARLPAFREWFSWAQAQGLVVASTQTEDGIVVLTAEDQWVPFSQAVLSYPLPGGNPKQISSSEISDF